jgi:hypothetical protein
VLARKETIMSYDDNVKIWKEAYTEIEQVCEKYATEFDNKYGFYDIADMLRKAQSHLRKIEYYEKYGIRLDDPVVSTEWHNIDEYRQLGYFDGEKRSISWPDDGKQPKDERLYCISFPTGAYIFGEEYVQKLFQEFFLELKSYNPKYVDTVNHGLYFSLDSAKAIHDNFTEILNKYHAKYKADSVNRRKEKLQAELEKLETSTEA